MTARTKHRLGWALLAIVVICVPLVAYLADRHNADARDAAAGLSVATGLGFDADAVTWAGTVRDTSSRDSSVEKLAVVSGGDVAGTLTADRFQAQCTLSRFGEKFPARTLRTTDTYELFDAVSGRAAQGRVVLAVLGHTTGRPDLVYLVDRPNYIAQRNTCA